MSEYTILDFHADWCGPCKTQDPILDEFVENNETVEAEKIDVDENQDRANEYQVRSLPTLIILDENEEPVQRFTGVTQRNELEDAIEA